MVVLFNQQVISDGVALDVKYDLPTREVQRADRIVVYVVFGAGTSAGAVAVEEAHGYVNDDDGSAFTGVWAEIGAASWSAANKAHSISVQGPFRNARVRIKTAIVGGNVDVYVMIAKGE